MFEIDDDVYFCDCGFMGDKKIALPINFMVKEEQFQHIKFEVFHTLFETFFNEKVEKKKLLAKRMFKTKVLFKMLCIYNKEGKYVIDMEKAPESITSN